MTTHELLVENHQWKKFLRATQGRAVHPYVWSQLAVTDSGEQIILRGTDEYKCFS